MRFAIKSLWLPRPLRFLKRQLPPLNFISIHYLYFICTCLISAIILWGSSTPARSLRFIDALFLAVSAMTLAGLNTVNLSGLNTFQQVVLFLLIILGSAIFVSAFVVHVRRVAFERRFKDVAERRKRQRESRPQRWRRSHSRSRKSQDLADSEATRPCQDVTSDHTNDNAIDEKDLHASTSLQSEPAQDESILDTKHDQKSHSTGDLTSTKLLNQPTIKFDENVQAPASPDGGLYDHRHRRRRRGSMFSLQGVGALPETSLKPLSPLPSSITRSNTLRSDLNTQDSQGLEPKRESITSIGGWISRNSQFHGLSEEERAKLGGYEYRAVCLLAWLVPAYFVLWQLLGALGCAAWVATKRPNTALSNGLNPWWVGAFNAISAFNNSGMSPLDANMTAFQTGYYLLITMSLLILAGNTCYPIFLRLIVWTMWKITQRQKGERWQERARTLRFLLDHPRRCYTNLFPSQHTWWLLFSVVLLNGIDWAAFEILNIGNDKLEVLPVNVRVIDGLFQATAVRSGGFYVVAIPTLRISLQVLYVVMMYISVYPVVITIRNSNVYEERSLGIYAEDQENDANSTQTRQRGILSTARDIGGHFISSGGPRRESNSLFVQQQLRAQLAHDVWVLVLALFLIMIIEGSQFSSNPEVFSVFNFIFEIVSAYGCVGISTGVPWDNYSFCGSWHTLSKLILCVVMLRGRHRGLPIAIDKAILLPGEATELAEEDDGRIRLSRVTSRSRQFETA